MNSSNSLRLLLLMLSHLPETVKTVETPKSSISNDSNFRQYDATPNLQTRKGLLFITMKDSNLQKGESNSSNSNDKIILFGIDGTLYKITDTLLSVEMEAITKAYEVLRSPSSRSFSEILARDCNLKCSRDRSRLLQILYNELNVTPRRFNEAMGEIPYGEYIQRDEELSNYLSKSNARHWCFTNSLRDRAEAILKHLGLESFFEGVICADYDLCRPIRKPSRDAYDFVEDLLGLYNPKNVYFFDDMTNNISCAEKRGWNACLVKPEESIVCVLRQMIGVDINKHF